MVLVSKTGLLEGVRKPIKRYEPKALRMANISYAEYSNLPSFRLKFKENMCQHVSKAKKIEFPNLSRPAPYTLRPFAGVYNPFPYGCSILCNHPADYEAKDVVKKAKDTWAIEEFGIAPLPYADGEDAVPEELFRRYTETDSRPLTPAPTLASGGTTRGSGRRCVTPEPAVEERTHLILDLRRSHSQDTLSGWHIVPKKPVQTSSASINYKKKCTAKRRVVTASTIKSDEGANDKGTGQKLHQQVMEGVKTLMVPTDTSDFTTDTTGASSDEELPRRRGKHRRRRKKSGQNTEPEKEFQGLAEPGETQISAMNDESNIGTSAHPSLVVGVLPSEVDTVQTSQAAAIVTTEDLQWSGKDVSKSFIDISILKQLCRALDQEVIDSEFDSKRKSALEEAMRIRHLICPQHESEEIQQLKQQLQKRPHDLEKWLTKPRNFSRRSARFEVPLDCRLLTDMTPMQYISRYVSLTSGRQLLYNRVFNRYKIVPEEDEAAKNSENVDMQRRILGKNVPPALGEVMGHPLSEEQAKYLQNLTGWEDEELLEFRQWAGICALCERLLAPQFMFKLPSRLEDPCSEIEQADFEWLAAQMKGMQLDPRLVAIFQGICKL